MKLLILVLCVVCIGIFLPYNVEAKTLCPNGFEYSTDWIFTTEDTPDKNGNGAICFKELPNGKIIFTDDKR